ncbi:two-component sensor histidine kinase BarA [Celerinatantimonas yamalensis]|uniref:histidine kinase n=1 Tax=Celerinatantimonas yamalensis TaxID=559956 RepID=A0ABW9G7V4_9GAMM
MTKYGLRARVYTLTILPTLLIGILLATYFISNRNQQLEQFAVQQGIDVIEPLAIASEFGLARHSRERVKEVISINRRKQSSQIHSIAVFTLDNQLFVTGTYHNSLGLLQVPKGQALPTTTEVIEHDEYIIVRAPIWADSEDSFSRYTTGRPELLGYIALRMDKERALLMQFRDTTIAIFIVLLGVLLSILFAYQLVRRATRPIGKMVQVVDRIRQGRLDTRVTEKNLPGELDMLKNGINAMAKSLAEYHEEMHQSIDQATGDLRETLEQIEIQNIELDMAKREAQQAAKMKSEFLANMSHELRTPLNGVLGFARQLQKTPLNPEQRDFLQTIENSATNLLSIINDILDFSKLEAGQLNLERIAFHLLDTTEEVVTLLAQSGRDKQLELVLDVDPDVPEGIYGDPLRYQQVLTNLIGNALKFTEHGHVIVHISTQHQGLSSEKFQLHVSIHDSGIGIVQEQQEQLFQAFRQADASISRHYGGTGLGLVITRKLVQQMGGDITLDSTPGEGSTFSFTIECDIADIALGDPLPLEILAQQSVYLFEPMPATCQSLNHLAKRLKFNLISFDSLEDMLQALQTSRCSNSSVILGASIEQPSQLLIEQVAQVTQYTDNLLVGVVDHDSQSIRQLLHAGATHCLVKPLQYRKLAAQLIDHTPLKESQLPLLAANPIMSHYPIRVLAVDDNPANLKLLSTMLSARVTQVDSCNSGEQALQMVGEHHYDLILMDIQMPGMDGIRTSAVIRQTYRDFTTPIVAVTAHASAADRRRLLGEQMDDYLSKPIDEDDLLEVIHRCCPTLINKVPAMLSLTAPPSSESDNLIVVSDEPIYDWQLALMRAAKNQTLAEEMLSMLQDTLELTQIQVQQALDGELDESQLRAVIHKLHGGCAYTGAVAIQRLAALIETQLTEQQRAEQLEPELLELLDGIEQLKNYDRAPPWR